jgi:hypothetical protein
VIDKSRKLATRTDLYGSDLVVSVLLVSTCELPILLLSLSSAKFVLPLGWLALSAFDVRRMWKAKVDHGLSSELKIVQVGGGLILVAAFGSWACHLLASIGTMPSLQFVDVCRVVYVANGVAGLCLYVLGIVAIWLRDSIARVASG